MDEGQVGRIHAVLEAVEEAAGPHVVAGSKHPVALEVGIARQRRCLALAQVSKDQSEVLLGWVAADLDTTAEGLGLGRLLRALPGTIVLPSMVEAAQLV